jgi:ArsR family transcriptional regulator, arsenate/arsenite/antimonite-responsive transcriptional repressor
MISNPYNRWQGRYRRWPRFDRCQSVGVDTTVATPICCPPVLAAPLSEAEASELADVLKALADPARLRLLSIIASSPDGEACACNLSDPLGRSQPTVSHHLTQLVRAGILEREQRGKWAWFRVSAQTLTSICAVLAPPPR